MALLPRDKALSPRDFLPLSPVDGFSGGLAASAPLKDQFVRTAILILFTKIIESLPEMNIKYNA